MWCSTENLSVAGNYVYNFYTMNQIHRHHDRQNSSKFSRLYQFLFPDSLVTSKVEYVHRELTGMAKGLQGHLAKKCVAAIKEDLWGREHEWVFITVTCARQLAVLHCSRASTGLPIVTTVNPQGVMGRCCPTPCAVSWSGGNQGKTHSCQSTSISAVCGKQVTSRFCPGTR